MGRVEGLCYSICSIWDAPQLLILATERGQHFLSMAMAFNPLSLLILKFRGRSVAVFRNLCTDYDVSCSVYSNSDICIANHRKNKSIIAVARRNLRPLQSLATNTSDVILLASIPGYPDTSEVELTREVWPTVSSVVHSVTITLESGASSSPKMSNTLLLPG